MFWLSLIRSLVRLGAIALGALVVLWLMAWSVSPDFSRAPLPPTPAQLAAAAQARDVTFDPHHTPSLHRAIAVTPRGQSPLLAQLVDEGKLPPLAERLPEEPVVMEGVDAIGVYGGTWLRVANAVNDVGIITWRMSSAYLVRWSPLGYPIEPHIARSVTPSADFKQWTVTLRPGMRWSDGHPYTANDIMYWWECEAKNPILASSLASWMQIQGQDGNIRKINDYQVVFEFPKPYPLFLEYLASRNEPCNTPGHYLRQFHPDPAIGNAETVERIRTTYKLPSARAVYGFMKTHDNPEHPRLWPWVCRTFSSTPPYVYVRNPFYGVVDTAGNQLPYIDRVQFDVQDGKILSLTAANGGVSMQTRHIRFADYTELMSRRASAGIRILHWYSATRSAWVINPNLNRRVDPNQPATAWKAQLLSTAKFRQALSLAINRRDIIQADSAGIGEPAQVSPGNESLFPAPLLAQAFTAYDPAAANRLLDELGLTRRDSEGYRTFPDGTRMSFFLDTTEFTGTGPAHFVVDDWAAVGVRCIPRERARSLFYLEKDGRDFDFNVWSGESDIVPLINPRYFIPQNMESFYATGWGKWYMRGGFFNHPSALKSPGAIPVPSDHPMYSAIAAYEEAVAAPTQAERADAMRRVYQIGADNLWTISIATAPPQLVVVKEGFCNVPPNALYGSVFSTPGNAGIETYFFEKPQDSPGAIADTKAALLKPQLRPGKHAAAAAPAGGIGGVIRLIIYLMLAALALLVVFRHPFILRRLVIMVPTLAIISLIVFSIIQMPPGDYLTTRIMQLQQSGDPTDLNAIEDLRLQFHFDQPAWKRYCRWVGLTWFVSWHWDPHQGIVFQASDQGLLQGNLGRSMESGQFVNDMVGDRILLTVLLSAGTILMTWMLAIPIGIYSAVKQYSLGDYLLTFLGFVGMCVPAFLLALVLMAVAGVSGLFSPQFAAQPEWTWPKFADMLQHIWIPIVVLGIGGTAGMIRVMRANLLDELRKPYVITAMAKGVRPLKLLLKYPVRLALNPFISGIGGLFPQIISGGAIVSMVLSLPMVGPMLLTALFSQDMYLAGSMLMVLSLLGVLGTLASDLLLLWLDPRIRFEGGTR